MIDISQKVREKWESKRVTKYAQMRLVFRESYDGGKEERRAEINIPVEIPTWGREPRDLTQNRLTWKFQAEIESIYTYGCPFLSSLPLTSRFPLWQATPSRHCSSLSQHLPSSFLPSCHHLKPSHHHLLPSHHHLNPLVIVSYHLVIVSYPLIIIPTLSSSSPTLLSLLNPLVIVPTLLSLCLPLLSPFLHHSSWNCTLSHHQHLYRPLPSSYCVFRYYLCGWEFLKVSSLTSLQINIYKYIYFWPVKLQLCFKK